MTVEGTEIVAASVPTAESGRTNTVPETSSERLKRKKISEYNFHCPCDRCEDGPPLSYRNVRKHMARMHKNIKSKISDRKSNKNHMSRALELNDRMNEFKALVKSGAWREIAKERNSDAGQPEVHQTDTVAELETDMHAPMEDDQDIWCDDGGGYDDNYAEYEEGTEDDHTDSDAHSEQGSEREPDCDFNDILQDSNTGISFEECTKPDDLDPYLLNTVERIIPANEPQRLVGDFLVRSLSKMLRSKYAMQNIASNLNDCSEFFPNMPSYNRVEALIRKIGSPLKTFFTCAGHHKMTCERGAICGQNSCGKQMNIQIKHIKIIDILRREMQDKAFAEGVRFGPGIASERTGTMETISSVWQSKAIADLQYKIGYDMKMTDDQIPIVIELFTDGFAPYNKSNYSIWCVLMRILNLPPEMGKTYEHIYPLVMIDGPKEPGCIDQYLDMVVQDIKDSSSEIAGTVYDAATKSQVGVNVFLLCSAQDTRALRLVAKHDETPSQYPCHKCKIKAENFKIGSGKGMHRVAYKISSLTDPLGKDDSSGQWSHNEVKDVQTWVETQLSQGATLSSIADRRLGIRGACAFRKIEYFDLVHGFLFCAMHGIQNAASRAESNVLGKFDTEILRKFLKLEGKAKWVMEKAPPDSQSRRADPNRYSEKNVTQARNYVSFIRTPSGFHGDPSRLFRKPSASKKKREEENESSAAKIKASEWKDFAVSGIMCAAMYFGGVDPDVVKAYDGLFYALKQLCSPVVNIQEIAELQYTMCGLMQDLENNLPMTEMPFHLHSLYHLPEQVLYYGPLSDLWSFPFESKFKDMKSMAKKKNAPVASLASRTSLEMAVGSIAVAMDNHHGEEGNIEPSNGRPSYSEKGLELPEKCKETKLHHKRELKMHIQNYYVPTDRFEEIIGQENSWDSLQDLLFFEDSDMPGFETTIPQIIRQLALTRFKVFEYDKISLLGIEIEHKTYVEKRKTRTDNSYLLLRASGSISIPSLARVESIYRIVFPDGRLETEDVILDERVLLRVQEYTLDDLDPDLEKCGLQDVFIYNTRTPGVDRLIELSSIQEQAFLSPDMRTIHGSLDEKAKFESYLVHSKGSLRNVDLSRFSKEKPI